MLSNFDIVKEQVDIVDVARSYGIEVTRNSKAHCPWHTDKTPSMSFKNNRFRCFSCGESGDVIDLVRILTNQEPRDALREINHSYHLGLNLEAPVSMDVISRRNKIRERREHFRIWENSSFLILNAYLHALREWEETLFPRHPDETPDPRYLEAIHRRSYIQYVLDEVYINGSWEEKVDFIISHECMIRDIEQRLIGEGVPYAGRNGTGARPAARFWPVVVLGGSEFQRPA